MKKIILLLQVLPFLACTLTNGAAAPLPTATDEPAQVLPTVTPKAITCTVTAFEALNLRQSPGMSSAVIAVLRNGDLLTILPQPAQGKWILVRAGGLEGWIHSNYCERN
ncbi:MAG: SH3 domain-containing protein [Alphaproteobacteria bacterium]|jgi:uncharacterized protein YgiM (DUF1202 family)|nr:SH3 domain-containing protein [Alphaproteobacteria bacterium]